MGLVAWVLLFVFQFPEFESGLLSRKIEAEKTKKYQCIKITYLQNKKSFSVIYLVDIFSFAAA